MFDATVEPIVWHQFGMPKENIQRWVDWYGQGFGYLGFVGFACAMTSCKERYGISPGDGDGIPLCLETAIGVNFLDGGNG